MKSEAQEHEVSLFEEIVLCLENDQAFYERYINCSTSANSRRTCIEDAIRRLRTLPPTAAPINWEDREILRRYFDNNWDMDPITAGAMEHSDTPLFPMSVLMQFPPWNSQKVKKTPVEAKIEQVVVECVEVGIAAHQWAEEQLSQLAARSAQPLEFNMLKITTKTLLNGKDIAEMSDEQLYDAISAAEAEIKKCEAIEHKPKKLVAKIAELNDGIAALVAHMDAQKS